jgi:hypothetical protein
VLAVAVSTVPFLIGVVVNADMSLLWVAVMVAMDIVLVHVRCRASLATRENKDLKTVPIVPRAQD